MYKNMHMCFIHMQMCFFGYSRTKLGESNFQKYENVCFSIPILP